MHSILFVGAALVGLPIVLHLIMKQEPKRLPFPAFRFLKQQLKTNQRKLRLRHFLLLALRMLLIALFCLTLYQPSLMSDGFIGLHGDKPLAVVVVIDTSSSMGYADGDKTHLEEACRRAVELVNDLPDGSRVAVVETGDPGGDWLPSVADARGKLLDLAKQAPKPGQVAPAAGGGQSVTATLAVAYQLLRTVDEQSEAADTLPRLVAVFTDRAAASWDPARVEDLKKLRELIPDPKPAHAVVDVGTDTPVNVAVLAAEMADGRPQTVPADQVVAVTVTLAAVGLDARATVTAVLDDKDKLPPREVEVPDGQTRTVTFEVKDLKPGVHQMKFELEKKDALTADNTRFFTFRVAEPRKVLTISDDPGDPAAGAGGDAYFWAAAVGATQEFTCVVKKPDAVTPADLAGAEVVTLLSVARPSDPLWAELLKYVEGGGKLVIIPGGEATALDAYNGEAASRLMPGALEAGGGHPRTPAPPKDAKTKDRRPGVVWSVFADDDRALQHPMLAPIKEWKMRGNVDAVRNPRPAWKYWEVERRGDGTVVVTYDTDDDPAKRAPAVLERTIFDAKDKTLPGKVLLLTTRMDTQTSPDRQWNDYWDTQNSWSVVFPQLLLRYAAGAAAEAVFNYQTGQVVVVPLGKLLGGKRGNLILKSAAVVGADAIVRPAARQTELRFGPPRTNTAENYLLTPAAAEGANDPPPWQEGFSLNLPAGESTLDKVPVEGIEDLTGPDTVIPVGKNLDLKTALEGTDRFRHPVDLFPWLLIAVLMLLVVEGFLANKFYRRSR